jgi:hypothetical protein
MTVSRKILLRMGNISNKSCSENQNTHFMLSNIFPKIVPFMRMSKNVVEPQAADNMCLCTACWISKATRVQGHACPCTHTHACIHPGVRAHAYTHREILNNYCFSMATVVLWTYLSIICTLPLLFTPTFGVSVNHLQCSVLLSDWFGNYFLPRCPFSSEEKHSWCWRWSIYK